jgi:predicted nucleic acid-binding protein
MSPGKPVRVTAERQRTFALDTNIFIYHFEENPVYISYTEGLFEKIESGRIRAVTSVLTLHEILTGARKAGDQRLVTLYRDLLRSFPNLHMMPFDVDVAEISSDLRARYGIPTPDAIQVATSIRHKAETFITNEERLAHIKEIKVTIPHRRSR